jgi:hypothetical protein
MTQPGIIAKRIVTQWIAACNKIAAAKKAAPAISFTRADDKYLQVLQLIIAEELERLQDEVYRAP